MISIKFMVELNKCKKMDMRIVIKIRSDYLIEGIGLISVSCAQYVNAILRSLGEDLSRTNGSDSAHLLIGAGF